MKALINGVWYADIDDTPELRAARMEEKKRYFRDRISRDPGAAYPPESGRYHLYVSYACPWAHRAILYRSLKGLEDVISMSVAHPEWNGPEGWIFGETAMSTPDAINGARALYEIYQKAKPDFTGKVTVPVLWDKARGTIVNNESGEIIRMFNSEFEDVATRKIDFYPEELRDEIDALNAEILDRVCMGVYKAGFASTQEGYDKAVHELFETLDKLEERLSGRSYLLGERVTESDWHLFCTLCRFDAVYHGALKCNIRRLSDYKNLSAYTRRLYDMPGVAGTVKLDHAKAHYYQDLRIGNPLIIPAGPSEGFWSDAA